MWVRGCRLVEVDFSLTAGFDDDGAGAVGEDTIALEGIISSSMPMVMVKG